MIKRLLPLTALALLTIAAPAHAGTVASDAGGLRIDTRFVTGPGSSPQAATTVAIRLESTPNGLVWFIASNRSLLAQTNCNSTTPEPPFSEAVRCARVVEGVSLTMGALDFDNFGPASGGLPFVDKITADLGPGSDRYTGFNTVDDVNGGDGNDVIAGNGGDDELSGGDGNDNITPGQGRDLAVGGLGNDFFVDSIPDGTNPDTEDDTYVGLTGLDVMSYAGRGAIIILQGEIEATGGEIGTTEGDTLRGMNRYVGGNGNDRMNAAFTSVPSDFRGNPGDDLLSGSKANDTLVGNNGADTINGNDGNDTIDGKAGEVDANNAPKAVADPSINCGAGSDLAVLDLLDDASPLGCEGVDRAPAGESPDARLPRTLRLRVRQGRVRVPLRCPRHKRRGCRGKVALTRGSKTGASTRYRLRRGKRARVSVAAPFRGKASVVTLERASEGRSKGQTRLARVR